MSRFVTRPAASLPPAEKMRSHIVNFRGLRDAYFAHKNTAIGDHPHQAAFFQAAAGFANRAAADAEHLGEGALVDAVAGLEFAIDDHALEFFGGQGGKRLGAAGAQLGQGVGRKGGGIVSHVADRILLTVYSQ